MTRFKGSDSRESRRNAKNAKRYPEMVETLNEFEAHLEHEANKIRFGALRPRNEKQARLIQLLEEKRLTFITGCAGTGKTFVATSVAAERLESGRIDRIIITRPMIGCDEEMGFLPGTEGDKFQPWLGPFLDVLEGKLGKQKVASYLKFGQIVARPLMMMRGTTFRNAMVLLDEAQNTTPGQMKMFLTRIGEGSSVVIDGDLEQTDLPAGKDNGLADILHRLRGSSSAGFLEFYEDEIVRDPLVRDIVKAYRNPK